MVMYYIEHVYLMPCVYSFCQIFQVLRLLAALRLFQTLEITTLNLKLSNRPKTAKISNSASEKKPATGLYYKDLASHWVVQGLQQKKW